jgi:hypothetical protein
MEKGDGGYAVLPAAFSCASLARISDSFCCKFRCPLMMWWTAAVHGNEVAVE